MTHSWTEGTVLVDSAPFHYTRTGGGKPVLVLNHGFSDAGLCWTPVARDLQADFDVIMPDARGHGGSPRVQEGQVIDRAGDLAGILHALRLEGAIVGGHSMGASTTAELAARYPGLARALILEDPAWRDTPPDDTGGRAALRPMRDWIRSLAGQSLDELVASCRAQNPAWAEAEWVPWAESKRQLDFNILTTDGGNMGNWRAVAPAISCPTLLITSEVGKGAIVTPEVAAQAAALNPLIHPVFVPGAGHNVRRENYPAFMQAVRAFLNEVRA